MSGKRDLFVGGQWVSAKSKAKFPVYNPSTGEVWAEIADAGRADAAAAIEAAAAAQPAWAALPHSKRAALLLKEDMEYMGPVRISDVEAAQQRIVDTVRRLEDTGEIIIAGRAGEKELIV